MSDGLRQPTGDRASPTSTEVPTRGDFTRQRAFAERVERRHGRILAAFSVAGGLTQLLFLRWADRHLPRGPGTAIAFSAFLLYLSVVVVLLLRMHARVRAAVPVCPRCGARLEGMSGRVATATGRCDRCGGEVFRPEP